MGLAAFNRARRQVAEREAKKEVDAKAASDPPKRSSKSKAKGGDK